MTTPTNSSEIGSKSVDGIEQRARELLDSALRKLGLHEDAYHIGCGSDDLDSFERASISAIIAALRTAGHRDSAEQPSEFPRIRSYRSGAGKFYFELLAADGAVLMQSQEFDSPEDAGRAAQRAVMQAQQPSAPEPYAGTWKEHFDIALSKRARAVSFGAVEETARDAAARCAAKRRMKLAGESAKGEGRAQ